MSYYNPGEWPTTDLLAPLISELYQHEPTGGFLHIVLDDYNIEAEFIHWCITEAHRHPCSQNLPWCHKQQELIGMLLLAVPELNRESLIRRSQP